MQNVGRYRGLIAVVAEVPVLKPALVLHTAEVDKPQYTSGARDAVVLALLDSETERQDAVGASVRANMQAEISSLKTDAYTLFEALSVACADVAVQSFPVEDIDEK